MRFFALFFVLALVSADHYGMEHDPQPKTSENKTVTPGDSNYEYDNSNQQNNSMDQDSSSAYLDLVMDMNMCLVEVIYKYNLSEAVKETKAIVDDSQWIIDIREASYNDSMAILGETMIPIARDLLNITGDELVEKLPDEILNWIIDSAVVFAVQ
jgi:hypothetical protein